VLLTVAEPRGALVPLVERATIMRLGHGVERTRRIDVGARERTLVALRQYRRVLQEAKVDASACLPT
jgi:exopolyphosphatase/pppGpp-phosphohydrolase